MREGEPASTGRSLERGLLWGILAVVLLAIAVATLLTRGGSRGAVVAEEVPLLGTVPPFSLLDQRGRTVTLESLAGQPWIASFVFTRCAISCPRMTSESLRLAARLAPGSARIVVVTVDPEHDTPPILASYLESYAAPADWLFLTGPAEDVRGLVLKGFKLAVGPAPPESPTATDEPLLHSTRFVLVDAVGQIRGYYDAFDRADVDRLVADVAALSAGH